jgi:hypothetical protein
MSTIAGSVTFNTNDEDLNLEPTLRFRDYDGRPLGDAYINLNCSPKMSPAEDKPFVVGWMESNTYHPFNRLGDAVQQFENETGVDIKGTPEYAAFKAYCEVHLLGTGVHYPTRINKEKEA